MHNILIIDNETILTRELTRLLSSHNYSVETARTLQECRDRYSLNQFDLIITELRLPDGQGTDIFELISGIPVIIITSYASLRSAVDAMRMGAVDYLPKPFDHRDLLNTVKRNLTDLSQPPEKQHTQPAGMVGKSQGIKKVFTTIRKVAITNTAILISGEPGTGKEITARHIHNQSSQRNRPFVSINCAAIPQHILEKELFGDEQNNRCGLIKDAHRGTLLLNEIHELTPGAQEQLLRVLQEGVMYPCHPPKQPITFRLISSSSKNLQQLCIDGLFKKELYYRINVVQMNLPPLRERGDDVVDIAYALLEKLNRNLHGKLDNDQPELDKETIRVLSSYPWPGNIRELENALQSAVILCDKGEKITPDLLGINLDLIDNLEARLAAQHAMDPPTSKILSLKDYFTRFVLENQGVMSETTLAKKLGISRKCLWERRQKFGLPRQKSAETKKRTTRRPAKSKKPGRKVTP